MGWKNERRKNPRKRCEREQSQSSFQYFLLCSRSSLQSAEEAGATVEETFPLFSLSLTSCLPVHPDRIFISPFHISGGSSKQSTWCCFGSESRRTKEISNSTENGSMPFHTCPSWNVAEVKYRVKMWKWNQNWNHHTVVATSPPILYRHRHTITAEKAKPQNHFASNALCVRAKSRQKPGEMAEMKTSSRTQTNPSCRQRKRERVVNVIYEWFYSFDMFSFPFSPLLRRQFNFFQRRSLVAEWNPEELEHFEESRRENSKRKWINFKPHETHSTRICRQRQEKENGTGRIFLHSTRNFKIFTKWWKIPTAVLYFLSSIVNSLFPGLVRRRRCSTVKKA